MDSGPHHFGTMTLVSITAKPKPSILPSKQTDKAPDTKNFFTYGPEHLRKINALRRAKSQPTISAPPALSKGEVLFSTAASRNGEPVSCYNCRHMHPDISRCELFPPDVITRKFVYPEKGSADSKPIEYWPLCGRHWYGAPRGIGSGNCDPDNSGLRWVNAPERDLEYGGANCGGTNGGDDCDYYNPGNALPKRDNPTGFCRVLQSTVANGDWCCAWIDDDVVFWREASSILRELEAKEKKENG